MKVEAVRPMLFNPIVITVTIESRDELIGMKHFVSGTHSGETPGVNNLQCFEAEKIRNAIHDEIKNRFLID